MDGWEGLLLHCVVRWKHSTFFTKPALFDECLCDGLGGRLQLKFRRRRCRRRRRRVVVWLKDALLVVHRGEVGQTQGRTSEPATGGDYLTWKFMPKMHSFQRQ